MKKAKIGVVALVTQEYTGSYRAKDFYNSACENITQLGIDVVKTDIIVKDAADAVQVCNTMKGKIHGLVIIDINWIIDSTQYIFTHELNVPTLFWALPYNETYSLACVHHFGTVLKWQHKTYAYVYGEPNEKKVEDTLITFARVAASMDAMKHMRLGLVGPRQTWRVAGPQDMTHEELEFSETFGTTILHIEMKEVLDYADAVDETEVERTKEALLKRSGIVEISEQAMSYMVRMYLAIKCIVEKYQLDAIAAETCPAYSGLMNVQASWLADEGFIVDTEGDIGHTMLQYVLSQYSQTPGLLGEICSYDEKMLYVYHEGSSAHSLARALTDVHIQPSGASGCYIGLSMKETTHATVASMVGNRGEYQMFFGKAKVEAASEEEWKKAGTGCLAKVAFGIDGETMTRYLLNNKIDHHFIVKEGDFEKELRMLCNFMNIKAIEIPEK